MIQQFLSLISRPVSNLYVAMRTHLVLMKPIVMLLQNYYKTYVEAKRRALTSEAILRLVASGLVKYFLVSGLEGQIPLENPIKLLRVVEALEASMQRNVVARKY
jgi:hypothetical protein